MLNCIYDNVFELFLVLRQCSMDLWWTLDTLNEPFKGNPNKMYYNFIKKRGV